MLRTRLYVGFWLVLICCVVSLSAQQAAVAAANAVVPPVVKFSGVLTDSRGKPMAGTVGVTFSLQRITGWRCSLGGNSKCHAR